MDMIEDRCGTGMIDYRHGAFVQPDIFTGHIARSVMLGNDVAGQVMDIVNGLVAGCHIALRQAREVVVGLLRGKLVGEHHDAQLTGSVVDIVLCKACGRIGVDDGVARSVMPEGSCSGSRRASSSPSVARIFSTLRLLAGDRMRWR